MLRTTTGDESTARASRSAPARRTWWRTIVTIGLSVLALLAGVLAFAGLASLKKPPEVRATVEKVYNVEVFDVTRQDLREIVSAFGTAQADREVVVSAQVAGEVIELHPKLRVGNRVRGLAVETGPDGRSVRREGELLVRIDPSTYQERVAELQAQLTSDAAELNRLKQEEAGNARLLQAGEQDIDVFREEYERIRKLSERGVAAQSQLTDALLQLKKYQQALINYENERDLFPLRRDQILRRQASHEAQLKQARHDLERTEVRTPFDGTLSEVLVDLGQFVRAGDPLVRITDLAVVDVPVPVRLEDFASLERQISSGQHPQCLLAENETAEPRWTGTVMRAAPEADQATRTVLVYVRVNNAEQPAPLLPGTFVHARIDGPVHDDVVAIPRDAILEGRLFVAENGRARRLTPAPQQMLQSLALFRTGLEPGQQIILTNLDVIHDGAAVEVDRHTTLRDELNRQRVPAIRPLAAEAERPADASSTADSAVSPANSGNDRISRATAADSP